MLIQRILCVPIVMLFAAGCATVGRTAPQITGDRVAHFTNTWTGVDPANLAPAVPVHHTFTLHNQGKQPVTIISHRTRIDTVWRFTDTNDGHLPRTINSGQSIEIAMRGTVRKPAPMRFFTDLTLNTGEVVTLELIVDDSSG